RSHERAAAANADGRHQGHVVPITVPADGEHEEEVFTLDSGVRPGTTMEILAGLSTPFRENGRITAGNASQISDGAAALLIMTPEKATITSSRAWSPSLWSPSPTCLPLSRWPTRSTPTSSRR